MCGIAGYFVPGGQAEARRVKEMCDQIRHRGPDDEGFHVDGDCAIGMRRLSIIDLSTGHQPIANEDQTVWIVFNGEIYNYREIRADLRARGHQFRTNSDTETLVHLYEDFGADGLRELRGMFAFAIWDGARRRLFLARDRFGKKPLYYAVSGNGIWFGSELKCLRGADIPFEVDEDALRLYFQFRYIPDPATVFRSIRRLPAGSWLTYDASGEVKQGRYWTSPEPAAAAPADITREQLRDRLVEVFDESVRIRMLAVVPLGAFLSGGVDSSSVVASMARQSPEPVKTFSIGFEETAFNELEYAALVARQYNTDHHEIVVKPNSVELVSRLVRHFDEPFADSSAIPTLIVSEFAARHVKVALSGDGGDELFAGYDTYLKLLRLRRYDAIPQPLRRAISTLADHLPYATYGKNFLRTISRPTALDRYFELNYTPYFLRRAMLDPEWMLPGDGAYLRRRFADCLPGGTDEVRQAICFETRANLIGDMLVKVDRASMAASLEVRCPMLDHRLAELAARIPPAWNLANGIGKAFLLEALGSRLPAGILHRKKMGFGIPISIWFRGPLREFLHDHLNSREFLGRGIVSRDFLQAMLNEHETGRRDNSHTLWALLMLELWFREWRDGISVPMAAHATASTDLLPSRD